MSTFSNQLQKDPAPQLVRELDEAGAAGAGWVVYLGLGPTALGFATYAFALRRMTPGRMASLSYLIPVVAIVLGWALLSETPPVLAVAGGALCVVGVYLARRRCTKKGGTCRLTSSPATRSDGRSAAGTLYAAAHDPLDHHGGSRCSARCNRLHGHASQDHCE
jgi:EamA-like transporter family